MQRTMCRAKIHRATVTASNLHYVGSITIDRTLMDEVDLLPYERVQVVNTANGERIETYVIEGDGDSGIVALNGAAARHFRPGDVVIIMVYGQYEREELSAFRPVVVFVDGRNRIAEVRTEELPATIYP